jgi:hypothetical protein
VFLRTTVSLGWTEGPLSVSGVVLTDTQWISRVDSIPTRFRQHPHDRQGPAAGRRAAIRNVLLASSQTARRFPQRQPTAASYDRLDEGAKRKAVVTMFCLLRSYRA